MKYITGFFMAWGNFITIPCPWKKWDKDLNNLMLGFLPSMGAIIGGLWTLAIWMLGMVKIPEMLLAFILMCIPFMLCGFLHLDGFMDCNDAIRSRRPLEERQRILKDSHIGAFAVVSVVIMFIGYFAAMCQNIKNPDLGVFFIIPMLSRTLAGADVLNEKPIGHSQYAKGAGATDKRGKRNALIVMAVQMVIYVCCGVLLNESYQILSIVIAVEMITVFISGAYARKQLGGMSGDIAGYEIVMGEFFAVMAMTIGRMYF